MDGEERLSRIVTQWSIVRQAHDNDHADRNSAQQALLERYGGAVRRYLLASLRDADAADEVFQEFALRFVRGDLRSANPDHGKFRNFLRTIVSRMVVDHHRRGQRRRKHEKTAPTGLPQPVDRSVESAEDKEAFSRSWREDLLSRSWEQLRRVEEQEGRPLYTILRHRVEHPDANSALLAEQLSERLGKPITAGNVRVLVHRARDKFAAFLLEEVADSVQDGSLDHVEQELIELRLHDYCREALQRRRKDE